MDFTLEFQDEPPVTPSKGGQWVERLQPLMEQPHRYAIVARGPYHTISQTAQNLKKKYRIPPGDWKFTVRKNDELSEANGKKWADLYAVYEGNGES